MTDPFVAKACDVVINTNYDTVGTLTRSSLDTLTPAQLKTLFTRDGGATWVDTGPWFKTAFEMGACGIKRNGFFDWIFGNSRKMGALVNTVKMDKSPSLILPFVLARQLSVINKEHWIIVGAVPIAVTAARANAGVDEDDFTKTPLTSAQFTAQSSGTAVIRIKTLGGFDLAANWFLGGTGNNGKQGDRVNTFTLVSGAAKMGQYVVLAAAAASDKSFLDLLVLEENGADSSIIPVTEGAAQDFKGVLLPGMNNVSDFESWCQNRPSLNPEKRVPFFFQTSRRARRVDQLYRETFSKLMKDNQYYAEFIDLPLAEKNRQDEEDWQRRKVNSFFFNKAISANQTTALYQSLEQVVTATPALTGAGASSVQGKFVGYRANFVGVYEQLKACGRVFDLGGDGVPINMKELFDQIYNIYRSRKSRNRNAMDIDIYTDNKTAEAFDRAMIRFFKDRSQDTMRMVTEIDNNDPKKALGFYWRSYRLPYPAGLKLHIITHETFDDWKNAFAEPDIETRGNLFLILDLGKGGIYPGIIATNRKTRTLGELENLAKIDPTYFCVMEHFTEEVVLTSETMTAVVECPSDNLWAENFEGFQVNNPLDHYGVTTDLIGDNTTSADWYR